MNTVDILEPDLVVGAVGGRASVTSILLTASDTEVRDRLEGREKGSELQLHLDRSRRSAEILEQQAPAGTHRVSTDGRRVAGVAGVVVGLSGWRDEHWRGASATRPDHKIIKPPGPAARTAS